MVDTHCGATHSDKTDEKKWPDRMERLAEFIHEAGMLRRTPRTGYQFLGSGSENVAEHSHRMAIIGYILAQMTGADMATTLQLCLFHDLHEARTGDFNYVNHQYNTCNARKALEDATEGTGLEDCILPQWDDLKAKETLEARITSDADQLDLIFNLLHERKMGNPYADEWLISARARLLTDAAKKLAEVAETVDPAQWWFKDPSDRRWIHHRDNS